MGLRLTSAIGGNMYFGVNTCAVQVKPGGFNNSHLDDNGDHHDRWH